MRTSSLRPLQEGELLPIATLLKELSDGASCSKEVLNKRSLKHAGALHQVCSQSFQKPCLKEYTLNHEAQYDLWQIPSSTTMGRSGDRTFQQKSDTRQKH